MISKFIFQPKICNQALSFSDKIQNSILGQKSQITIFSIFISILNWKSKDTFHTRIKTAVKVNFQPKNVIKNWIDEIYTDDIGGRTDYIFAYFNFYFKTENWKMNFFFQISITNFIEKLKIENPFLMFQPSNLIAELGKWRNREWLF